jgi:L-malate glycosyltransferase
MTFSAPAPTSAAIQGTVSRPKLMLFTDGFACGGTERQFLEVVTNLDRSKYDIIIGCIRRSGPLLCVAERLSLPIVDFPLQSLHQLHTLRQFCAVRRFVKSQRVDLFHAFGFVSDIFAVPAAVAAKVPVTISSVRLLPASRPKLSQWLLRMCCGLADAVFCNSSSAAAMMSGQKKIYLVRNVIDVSTFQVTTPVSTLRNKLGLSPNAMLVGVVAMLRPEKDHETLLRAASKVVRTNQNVEFVLVGDGPRRPFLESLVTKLGLPTRVRITGFQNNVAEYLAAIDISVLSSRAESLSNAILESMAAGRAVIATDVGGASELITHGSTGLLVPAGNPDDLARSILKLVDDKTLRMTIGIAAKSHIQREFGVSKAIREFESIYDSLLVSARNCASRSDPLLRSSAG